MMDWRLRTYRRLQDSMVRPWILPRLLSEERLSGPRAWVEEAQLPAPVPGRKRIWFHAASVGELESLWTVAVACANAGMEILVTVLSESAGPRLSQLEEALIREKRGGSEILFVGYCPWEGHWGSALERVRPDLFMTAKYEAWPELWASLGRQNVPLLVLGARQRRSLSFAKWACQALGASLPRLEFLIATPSDRTGLLKHFPAAGIHVTGEPRWDRVAERSRQGSSRASELIRGLRELARPWGVLGSVWAEDLKQWEPVLAGIREQKSATLWLVPHKTDPAHVDPCQDFLIRLGFRLLRTSRLHTYPAQIADFDCVLVDEMGFLSELYAEADWAYVGGGFGQGLHSTIEPAIHGIPISAGTHRARKFPEVDQLIDCGQLTLVRDSKDLAEWVRKFAKRKGSLADQTRWQAEVQAQRGATDRVLEVIEKLSPER